MEQTFNQILESFLDAYEQSPEKNVDDIISEELAKQGASDDTKDFVEATNKLLDKYHAKRQSLSLAKENGFTREQWIQEELLALKTKYSLTDEQVLKMQDEFVSAVQDTLEDNVKNNQ